MVLPDKIREDLVDRRNDVVHQGIHMTSADAKAAISAAWKVAEDRPATDAVLHFAEARPSPGDGYREACELPGPPLGAAIGVNEAPRLLNGAFEVNRDTATIW